MLHYWCKILSKSDIICLSYKKVHKGLLFSGHSVVLAVSYVCDQAESDGWRLLTGVLGGF